MKFFKLKKAKYYLIILLLTCSSRTVFAQGGWNIRYIQIDQINSSLLGNEVMFDFKQSNQDTLTNLKVSKLDTRSLLISQDTIEIIVKNEKLLFIERWKLYDDQGFVEEQYIESLNPLGLTIKQMTLKKISNCNIVVDAVLVGNGLNETIEISLDKTQIKGVLIKE